MAWRLGLAWTRTVGARMGIAQGSRWLLWVIPPIWWIQDNVAAPVWVRGQSMYPFLNDRYNETTARDLGWTFKLNAHTNVERGMVVTFWSPSDPYKLITKRIVALAGDVVHTKPPFPDPTVRVPDGHVWVEGDNGRSSLDSNTYGPVSARLIEGRLTHILYPFYKFGRVKWWEWEEPEESKRARRL